jgi:peptidoglycan hydrolase-like protein with peptidoglycan-binding domain
MKLNRGRLMMAGLFAALMLMAGTSASSAAAQTKATAAARPKAKSTTSTARTGTKAGSRTTKGKTTASRTRGQTAPTRERIIEIQQALAREGFYSGTPSGKWDAPTSQAMSSFQKAKGLTPTGKLGALSLQKLGLGSEIAGRAAPNPQADTRPSVLSESDLNDSEPETKEQ